MDLGYKKKREFKNYRLLLCVSAALLTRGVAVYPAETLINQLEQFINEYKPSGRLFRALTDKAKRGKDIEKDLLDGLYSLQDFMIAFLHAPNFDKLHIRLTIEQANAILQREKLTKDSKKSLDEFMVYLFGA